jgi:aldehyde dehydrogenase (NAD+)
VTSLPTSESLLTLARSALAACGANVALTSGSHSVRSPINGLQFGSVAGLNGAGGNELTVDIAVERATAAFATWRTTPAPRRAEVVRHLAALLREHIGDLATIVSIEAGKIRSEALGEVQEMIDICDYAVGLSRTMGGHTMASERPGHRLMETWHPIGPVGVISAFNFPVAVWSWNAMIAAACGDTLVWKPSSTTPLTGSSGPAPP